MPRRSKSMVMAMAMAMAMAMVVTMGKRFSHSLYIQTPDRPPQQPLLVVFFQLEPNYVLSYLGGFSLPSAGWSTF